jgi:hypothetical protein
MKIQFKCRFLRTKTQEEKEQEAEEKALAELLGKDTTISTDKVYEYDIMVHDSDNIVGWNPIDSKHIAIRTKTGELYTVRADINKFSERWMELTGEQVVVI